MTLRIEPRLPMEEGTRTKKTIYVGGISEDTDEQTIIDAFSTFGDIIDIQIPPGSTNPNVVTTAHRGFAFVTYSTTLDALDAIDNMDLNELKGNVLRVNLARPAKGPVAGLNNRPVWESEDWLSQHAKPVGPAGVGSKAPGGVNEETADGQDDAIEE